MNHVSYIESLEKLTIVNFSAVCYVASELQAAKKAKFQLIPWYLLINHNFEQFVPLVANKIPFHLV